MRTPQVRSKPVGLIRRAFSENNFIEKEKMMGGLLGSPSPPPLPVELPPDNTAAEEEVRRKDLLARKRRGRRGTIATSNRGLLSLSDNASKRKSLLGE